MTGIGEVLHARFVEHSYPLHTHDTWTLLIVDRGAVRYKLDRHDCLTAGHPDVALLPPHVPHDGRPVDQEGFRKRVLYVDTDSLDARLSGAAADTPNLTDPLLRHRLHQLHVTLSGHDDLEAQSRFAFLVERVKQHLRRGHDAPPRTYRDRGVAGSLREMLDVSTHESITLDEAARSLNVHRVHLVRSFSSEFGIPPHVYLTGKRVELARRRLLAGERPSDVASAVGFYDQSHLTRHFKRMLGVSPGQYARGDVARSAPQPGA